jgi:tRNA nucleotidyltransferase/poly(A) polymerase
MPAIDPTKAKSFATDVIHRLRAAGFEALWAGGCVRDHLLGRPPKDYDVATSATPEQIRQVFGKRRTLAVGAAFGVITVLGPRGAGQVEVATFRSDANYSDGRHPDHVTFSSPEEDAQRRDFTVNGLFFDPISTQVVDFVGGQDDLARKIIRAIGDPDARIGEDKLRLLRAVRFASTYGFDIEAKTLAAISARADEIRVVSAERIAEELRRMLGHPNCHRAVQLLRQTNLLEAILPEFPQATDGDAWQRTVDILKLTTSPSFPLGAAALFREIGTSETRQEAIRDICRRWRLTNDERDRILCCLERESILRDATSVAWPKLQRVLIGPHIEESLVFAESVARAVSGDTSGVAFCREKLALPTAQWNPPPLISGEDLKNLRIPPGPRYGQILEQVRDAQLLGTIQRRDEALRLAEEAYRKLETQQ